jgi:hypothetical protein
LTQGKFPAVLSAGGAEKFRYGVSDHLIGSNSVYVYGDR